ncbi:two-component system sensor histidine kinase NtrB [Desulfotomaculum sp. 1211_IL3151]|uniref:two-component system sensor histidine kinase NtrB n=1 Tax=Desulfotomaculum sp. 1211_IL3151 TaxID=3084055 RepID=UPI002FD8D35F
MTMKRMMEEQVEHNDAIKHNKHLEKIKLTGELTAGIAHEIRNPMTTVRGLLQFLMKKREHPDLETDFGIMIKELDRVNFIITEALLLDPTIVVNLKLQNLNVILKELSSQIIAKARDFNSDVAFEMCVIPDLFLNKQEISKLILQLSQNGLEAMPTGGVLTIKTFMQHREIVLAIQDQGMFIKPEVLERMGTPFFSTKDQGTGLGLAVCYSIAARHHAFIQVESAPTGTTFLIYFPLGRQMK